MNILMVSSYLPYPLFSGGHIRLYNLLRELSQNHQITLVCEKRSNQTDEDIAQVKKICKNVITVERKKQWSFQNILRSGFSFYPFLLVGHTNLEMMEQIQRLLAKEKFDLIHVETFYVMQNIPKTNLPVVLAEHNIEYLVYERFANQMPFLKPLLLIDTKKIKYWEQRFWKEASRLIAVSEEEKNIMGRCDAVVPNGVDIEKFRIKNLEFRIKEREKRILFIGDFKWVQNRDGVNWLLKEIWPKIISKLKSQNSNLTLKMWVVGKNIPDSIKNLTSDEDVIFDENAPSETQKIFEEVDLLLAPIRVGGGTSFKILEAMASGVPVVTTSLGIEGITIRNGEESLISDTAEGLADQVVNVLQNEDLYNKIIKNARKLIEEKYDWKIIVKRLEQVYESTVT